MKGVFLLCIILTAHLVLAEEGDEIGTDDTCTKIFQNVRKQLEESKEPFDKMLDYACANVGESKVSYNLQIESLIVILKLEILRNLSVKGNL